MSRPPSNPHPPPERLIGDDGDESFSSCLSFFSFNALIQPDGLPIMESRTRVFRFMMKTRDKQNEAGLLRHKEPFQRPTVWSCSECGWMKNKHFTLSEMDSTECLPTSTNMLNEQSGHPE